MKAKLKTCLIISIVVATAFSGCLEQTDQFIKHPYIPGVSAGDRPITDSERIIGKWEWEITNVLGTNVRYTFRDDKTGVYETSIEGKQFFKYSLFQNKILLTNLNPCRTSLQIGLPPNDTCDITLIYSFNDDNNLVIGDLNFERKWI